MLITASYRIIIFVVSLNLTQECQKGVGSKAHLYCKKLIPYYGHITKCVGTSLTITPAPIYVVSNIGIRHIFESKNLHIDIPLVAMHACMCVWMYRYVSLYEHVRIFMM